MLAIYNPSTQTVAANQTVVFSNTRLKSKRCNAANFTNNNAYITVRPKSVFQVSITMGVASATTTDNLTFALALDDRIIPGTTMINTTGVADAIGTISLTTVVPVNGCPCDEHVLSVVNTGTATASVSNAELTLTRLA